MLLIYLYICTKMELTVLIVITMQSCNYCEWY